MPGVNTKKLHTQWTPEPRARLGPDEARASAGCPLSTVYAVSDNFNVLLLPIKSQ